MPQRREIRWSELKVGIVALAGISLFTLAVFLITGQTGFFSETIILRAYTPDAGGLRTGAVVRLAGVDVGNVQQVGLSGRPELDETVEIVMEINARYAPDIRTDSEILLGTEGVLGDRYINITRGTAAADQIPPGGTVPFRETAEFTELVGGSRDLLDNLNVLITRLNSVVETIDSGEGTIGRFINDPTLYNRLDSTVASAEQLVAQISAGEGTLGQLLRSRELYDNVNQSVAKLQQVADRIERGEGTVGKLLNDPTLYENAQQLMARGTTLVDNGTTLVNNINQGQGTLGKLVTDDALHQRVTNTIANLDGLLSDVRQGDGTITRLLHDPRLYESLNMTSVEVREMIADFRQNPRRFLTIQLRIF
jgi:phospholipid/cholesterol/gamma-HCH transport system substrate-binding protein